MSPIIPRPFDHPDLLLTPENESIFERSIESFANPAQLRRGLVVDLKKSTATIRHKINVLIYEAALICLINPQDFQDFKTFSDIPQIPPRESKVDYKGWTYNLRDFYHYRLAVSLFVETLAASAFSLFDVFGRLINDLYDLGMNAEATSFKKAHNELTKRRGNNSDVVVQYLDNYRLPKQGQALQPNTPSWLPPLEEIRHRTTHRPITDICVVRSQTSMYPEIEPAATTFFLAADLFSSATEFPLCDFVREVSDGVQIFVGELYDLLRYEVERQQQLPLS